MVSIIVLNSSKNQWLRLSSIVLGLLIGFVVALLTGVTDFSKVSQVESFISISIPFKYGLDFNFLAFISVAIIYIITTIESSGDITANCMICKQDIKGDSYIKQVKNGVLGDGVNSLIAATFNTFPNTTFSQNNGVIHLTGIASRHIGVWIGGKLIYSVFGSAITTGGLSAIILNLILGDKEE